MNAFDAEKLRKLSKECEDMGWTRIVRYISYPSSEWKWLQDHEMNVCRIPLLMEIWFENAEDAMAFKLKFL